MSALLGNYVAPVPAQQRRRQALVPGHRRRDLPVPEHHRRREAGHRRGGRRRPRVPDGLLRRWSTPTSSPGPAFTVAGIRQPIEHVPTSSASSRPSPTTATDRRRSSRSRPTRPGSPTPRTSSSPRWATTSPTPTRWSRPSTPDADEPRPRATTWAATSSPGSSSAARRRVYDFIDNDVPGSTDRDRDYWRDVGTLDAYYDANMDLISVEPVFNLYNDEWPLFSGYQILPPAKFVHAGPGRLGHAADSMVSPGVLVSGATVVRLGALPERAPALVGDGQRLGPAGRRGGRPARAGAPRDPRQERRGAPSGQGSVWTTSTTWRAVSPSPTRGITVVPKGTVVTS